MASIIYHAEGVGNVLRNSIRTMTCVGKRSLAVATIIVCLTVTACGGDTSGTATPVPTATNTAAAATTAPVPATAPVATSAPAATIAPAATTTPAATTAPTTAPSANGSAPAGTTAASSASSGGTKLTGTPVPLVLYAAHGAAQPMADAFTKTTGIPVKITADSTGPLLAKIQAETNNPQWHMLWIDGAEAFASLDAQGQLLKGYAPEASLTDLGKSVQPADKSYIPTGVTIAGTIIYDTTKVKNPPMSWQDLLKPEYKGLVGMNNPAISGPTYPFVSGMMQYLGGEDQGKAFFKQLKDNNLHVYTTNKVTLNALASGEVSIAIIQSSAAIAATQKTPTLKTIFLPKVSVLPSNIGIDGKAPAQAQTEAKIFAEFVLSSQGQQIMREADPTGDSLYYPLVTGATPLPFLPPLASIPTQNVDPIVWGAKQNEINKWFTDNIAQ